MGSVRRVDKGVQVQVKLYNIRTQQAVFSREYTGSAANPRLYAHTVADEIHQQQRALRGVARTKLTFSSDRDSEALTGPIEQPERPGDLHRRLRRVQPAACDRRTHAQHHAGLVARRPIDRVHVLPEGLSRRPRLIHLSREARLPGRGTERNQNFLPAWSPDGKRLALVSNRDGNSEIYVMNADGSSPRRLTNHPMIDVTPTWSPTGNQIAFTSDRSGSPQIYIVDVDGAGLRRVTTESYCDRPTWSPSPQHNEIAYASRTGPGYDIKVSTSPAEASGRSPAAKGRTRARRSRRTAGT